MTNSDVREACDLCITISFLLGVACVVGVCFGTFYAPLAAAAIIFAAAGWAIDWWVFG